MAVKAKARPHIPGKMNRTESAYADHLEAKRKAGEIYRWRFEPMRLRLTEGDWKTTYTPDFMVLTTDGEIQMHEVKGFWRDDARVKLKVAADRYPEFLWKAVQKRPKRDGGGWSVEVFG